MMQKRNYIRCGGYYIPDIRLPEENRPIGRWGRMHRDYLQEHNPIRLDELCLTGEHIWLNPFTLSPNLWLIWLFNRWIRIGKRPGSRRSPWLQAGLFFGKRLLRFAVRRRRHRFPELFRFQAPFRLISDG